MRPDATRALAEFVAGLRLSALPAGVVEDARTALLDHVGNSLFAAFEPWSAIVAELGREFAPQGPCTVYGRSWRTGPLQSALANGTMAHGFELDDVVLDSLTHLGAVTIPAALAVGEVAGATGARFLEGIVAGYEVGARVGRAVGPSHMLRGFHPTGTNGVFGAIGAAGKVLGLSAEELVQAFGIGASLASGVTAFAHDPQAGMVKRLHAGRAAEGGVLAVLLAKRGFTAPSRGIDGRLGYVESFSDQPDWEALTAGLGERFAISANLIKPYACCGILHPAVDAVRALKARHGISGDDVEHVRVGCPRKGCEQNTIPDPRDVMSAQYSMEFAVAAALAGDILDPNVFRAEAIGDPRVRGLLPRVEVALDEEMESLFPRKTGARVTVRLRDGREFTETVYDALGTPGNPMGWERTLEKYRALTRHRLSDEAREAIVQWVRQAESQPSLEALGANLRGPWGR